MSTKRIIYETRLETLIDHTPSVRELVLKFQNPDRFEFRAGQFVMLHLPHSEAEKPVLRAYSIASDDRKKDQMNLIFKYVPNGLASTYVWSLKGGEKLLFTGPFGRIFFPEPPPEQLVFLCTGTGLAPHLSFLVSKADLFPNVKYKMLFGLSKEEDLFHVKELELLKNKIKNFEYEIVLSRPREKWNGKKGYIQNFLGNIEYKKIATAFYLCGNGEMIRQTKHTLIERDGIDPTKIFSEAFD